MKHAVAGALMLLAVVVNQATAQARFDFGVIGDVPYTAEEEARMPALMQAMNAVDLAFVVHVGDMHADPRTYRDGAAPCTDETLARRKAMFDSSRHPMLLTPGDNDWTDCHYDKAKFDPLERLAKLRAVFFADEQSLGQRRLALSRQSADPAFGQFRENARWIHGGIVFVTVHTVGSNNNRGRTPEQDAEYAARNAADLAWVKAAFELAARAPHKGLVILTQANPWFEERWPERRARSLRLTLVPSAAPSGFADLLSTLESETVALGKPVLFVHGDTHYFRVDKPLFSKTTERVVAAFTRVETFGSPEGAHWVRVSVDPGDPNLFAVKAELVGAKP